MSKLQILHLVLVPVYLKIATTDVKTFINVALETAKEK
jgi:hypothetical protein